MTPSERLLAQCPWKEYTTEAGKKYYHNINTKESRWTTPPELEEIRKKVNEASNAAVPISTLATQLPVPVPGMPAMPVPQVVPPIAVATTGTP